MIMPPNFYGKFIRSVWMMSLETGVVIEDEITTKLSMQLKYSTFFMINLKLSSKSLILLKKIRLMYPLCKH